MSFIAKSIAIATETVVIARQTESLSQVKYCHQSDARNLHPIETNDSRVDWRTTTRQLHWVDNANSKHTSLHHLQIDKKRGRPAYLLLHVLLTRGEKVTLTVEALRTAASVCSCQSPSLDRNASCVLQNERILRRREKIKRRRRRRRSQRPTTVAIIVNRRRFTHDAAQMFTYLWNQLASK